MMHTLMSWDRVKRERKEGRRNGRNNVWIEKKVN
jgi:hypothetical protein